MPKPERLVFVGNCQVEFLYSLFVRFLEDPEVWTASYVRSYEEISPGTYEEICHADIVVRQIADVDNAVSLRGLPDTALHHTVPLVSGAFLWPFSGVARPGNSTPWFLPAGPFPAEMGDSFLNRAIQDEIPPDEAIRKYLALNVPKVANLDRRVEITLDRQESRDRRTGYRFAEEISDRITKDRMFLTPFHPAPRLAQSFATQFFSKIGASRAQVEVVSDFMTDYQAFPREELPMHPSVLDHLNIAVVGHDYHYRFLSEGEFSFEDYGLRYLRGEWNSALAEGAAWRRAGDFQRAVTLLDCAVTASPNSSDAWCELAESHEGLGMYDAAEAAFEAALAVKSSDQGGAVRYAAYLARRGQPERATLLTDRLENGTRHDSAALGVHAHCLAETGRFEEALKASLAASTLEPNNAHLHGRVAHLALQLGSLDVALAAAQRAVYLSPASHGFYRTLAAVYRSRGQLIYAMHTLKSAPEAVPDDQHVHEDLAALQQQFRET